MQEKCQVGAVKWHCLHLKLPLVRMRIVCESGMKLFCLIVLAATLTSVAILLTPRLIFPAWFGEHRDLMRVITTSASSLVVVTIILLITGRKKASKKNN